MSDQLQADVTVFSNQSLCCSLDLTLSWPKTKLQNMGAGDPSSTILIILPTIIDRLQLGWLTGSVDPGGWEVLRFQKKKCRKGQSMFWPPQNVTFFHSKLLLYKCKFYSINDEQLDTIISLIVPSTDKVCSALRYRKIYPLGRRHEYTGGFPHEVSATDIWCTLVGSCLECRGASTIWFGDILRQRRLSLFGHVARLDPGVGLPAHDALRLMVDTYTKAEITAGEDRRVALATSGSTKFMRMPTLYYYLCCGDMRSPWVTELNDGHSDYATTMMVIMMMMKDDLCQEWR